MRASILSLLALVALPAHAQTAAAPSKEALNLGGRVAHAAQPQIERGLQTIVDSLSASYRTDAGKAGLAVDEKILTESGKDEYQAARPLLWDGMARTYAETYSLDELKALDGWYRQHPGDSANLPAPLAAKTPQLQQREQELVAQLGPRIIQDLFGEYCSRAACSDAVRQTAGLPLKGKN
ncbi:MAG TPA: DUF2059 domain-containing protein [Caulobacteraceae bacterium]|jgi:hypothetical protein